MKDKIILGLTVMTICLIGLGYSYSLKLERFKKDAIAIDYAQYHPTTGKWEWKVKANE